jgi:outer membrane murein-binding lipoprotein Lpp
MKKVLFALTIASLLVSGTALANGGAKHDKKSDTTQTTGAPADTMSSDTTSHAIETQEENWDKIENNTGTDVTYSYKYVCDSGGSCMTVDPPRFQR